MKGCRRQTVKEALAEASKKGSLSPLEKRIVEAQAKERPVLVCDDKGGGLGALGARNSGELHKETSEARNALRAVEKEMRANRCQEAADGLMRFAKKFYTMPATHRTTMEDRYRETYFEFGDRCVRTRIPAYDPESGQSRADYKQEIEEKTRLIRSRGLMGVKRSRR